MKKIFRTETLTHYATRWQKTRESEITDIKIECNNIYIKSEKNVSIARHFSNEWKTKTTKQEKQANIEDIEKIYYRRSKWINGIYIAAIIFALLMLFFSSKEIIFNYKNWFPIFLEHIAVDGFFSMLWIIIGLPILTFLCDAPTREIFIKFKDGDKIRFSYYKFKGEETIRECLREIKNNTTEIRICNKRKIADLKLFIIIFLLISLQFYFAYNSKFERAISSLENAIKAGNYYTTEEFTKLKYLKRDKILGYNIYENETTKEKIRIKEEKSLKKQQEYNFLHIKYFSKTDNNKFIGEKYSHLGTGNSDNEIHLEKDNIEYYFLNGKEYKFYKNVLGNECYYKIEFFNKEENEQENWNFLNKHKLYEFIYSDKEFINNENNNFKSFEKKEVLNSEYGKCYIIKSNEYSHTSRRIRCIYLFYIYRN